jgi:hypothetical protein
MREGFHASPTRERGNVGLCRGLQLPQSRELVHRHGGEFTVVAGAAPAAPTVPDAVTWQEGLEYAAPTGDGMNRERSVEGGLQPCPSALCSWHPDAVGVRTVGQRAGPVTDPAWLTTRLAPSRGHRHCCWKSFM